VAFQEVAGVSLPGQTKTPEQRIGDIEKITRGTLPARMSLALSQSSLDDPGLERASRLLASYFDLPPAWFYQPDRHLSRVMVARGSAPTRFFQDPGDPTRPLSWAAAKRFARPFESKAIDAMLAGVQGQFDSKLVAQTVRALAPISGERVPFAQVFAAVLQIASGVGAQFDVARFEQNMRVISQAKALDPMQMIAIAHTAAEKGLTFASLADVAKLVLPEQTRQIEAGQQLARGQVPQTVPRLAPAPGENPNAPRPLSTQGQVPAEYLTEAQYGLGIVGAFKSPGDLMRSLQERQDDYIQAAKDISNDVRIPFTDSYLGSTLGYVLNRINRPFDIAMRTVFEVAEIVASPATALYAGKPGELGHRSIAEIVDDAGRDAMDIWHGNTDTAKEMEKLGIPPWATAGLELFGAWKIPQLDPLIAAGGLLKDVNEARTIFGAAEADRLAGWQNRVLSFVDDPIAKIGDLRNVTTSQYLLREADRSRNAATFYNRAVDSFRRTFSTDGLHPMVADRIWRFAGSSRQAGMSEALRERAVDEVLLASLGMRPSAGSLAAEIDDIYRARRALTVEQLPLQLSDLQRFAMGADARVQADVDRALGIISDSALTLSERGPLMIEIPHLSPLARAEHALHLQGLADNPLGRSIDGLFQAIPKRIGARFTFNIEDQSQAVRDFTSYLERSKVYSVEEIAKARLDLSAAIRSDNPARELSFVQTVSRYDRLTVARIAKSYGMDETLTNRIIERLDETMGRARRQEAFGVAAAEPGIKPGTFTEPILVTQRPNEWQALDPMLFRRGIAETIGTWRSYRAHVLAALGKTAPGARAVKIPLRKFLDNAVDLVVQDLFLSWFKALVVIRPAYVLRVPGFEEQARFAATLGMARRVESGTTGSRVLSGIDGVLGRDRALEVPWSTPDGLETRVLEFPRPGRLPNEPLANNLTNRFALASEEGPARRWLQGLVGNRWGAVGRDEKQFHDFWWNTLQEQFGRDTLGRRYLDDIARNVSEEESATRAMDWLFEKGGEGPRYVQRLMGEKASEVARESVELQVRRGVHYARDLTSAHPELAAAARDGLLKVDDLRAVPLSETPAFVHGPLVSETVLARIGPIKRMVNGVGRWILQEPTNRLSRQPYFKSWYDRVLRSMVQLHVDSGGVMTDELMKGFQETARQFAVSQVKRIMFDFTREGRLDELTRHVLMFVQPFLEFPVVWARIARQNPAMIGYAVRLGHSALESGFIHKDPNTGELTVPMSWWAGAAPLLAAVTGGQLRPIGQGGGWELSAPLTSFNLFAQSALSIPTGGLAGEIPVPLPSINPEALWVLQQLVSHDAVPGDLKASVKARLSSWLFAYGDVTPSNPASLLPPYIRRGLEALVPQWFQRESDLNATHFLQLQQAMGITPNVEQAKTQAREFAGLRALFSLVFPAAPQINWPTEQLESEWDNLTSTMPMADATKEWMARHPDLRLLTIARTMWNQDNPSPVPIPPNKLVDRLLQTKGAREFAAKYPQWIWAIIPSELRDAGFDYGSWFRQLSSGQRVALSPEEFLTQGDVQEGWDSYFAEQERWTAWQDTHPDLGPGDPSYEEQSNDHADAISEIAALHPDWATHYGVIERQGVDPRVLAQARHLVADSTFTRTDTGKGLVAYMALRTQIQTELAGKNLSSVRTMTAERLGITGRYDDGVASIIEQHPDFKTAYRLFFFSDLQHVKTAGDRALDAIPENVYDTQITPWWEHFEQLREVPNMARDEASRNMAYEDIRAWTEKAYEDFPKGQNPMILRWQTWSPPERSDYLVSLIGRGYSFYSRFDRETLLGERSDPATEGLWTTYNILRTEIAQREATDPNFVSSDAYKRLDAWVLLNSASNPTFATQVADANTWGFAFSKVLPELVTNRKDSGPYWQAFLDALGTVQQTVDAYQLHGDSEADGKRKAAYTALRSALSSYVDQLRSENLAFARQWDSLEEASGPDPLLGYFMPDSWYRLGGYPEGS
jgi:hypothetical protein